MSDEKKVKESKTGEIAEGDLARPGSEGAASTGGYFGPDESLSVPRYADGIDVGLSRAVVTADELRREMYLTDKVKRKYEEVSLRTDIAFLVYAMRKKANLSQGQLAEMLGVKQGRISQLEDPSSSASVTLDQIETIARLCKVRIRFSVEFLGV